MLTITRILEGERLTYAFHREVRVYHSHLVGLPFCVFKFSLLRIRCSQPDMQSFRGRVAFNSVFESTNCFVITPQYVVRLPQVKCIVEGVMGIKLDGFLYALQSLLWSASIV
jgi:hypothetical protein